MAGCGIKVLAQQSNRALVRVTCAACQDESLLQIVFQTEGDFSDSENEFTQPVIDEGMPTVSDPISADEILDLHSFLAGFDSSLRELVKPKA